MTPGPQSFHWFGSLWGSSSSHICPQAVGGSIQYAEGGTWAKVSIPTGKARGGGPRSTVSGFSAASRRRLLAKLNMIDRRNLDTGRVLFVTLTYPAEFPSARASKRDLQTFRKRLERAWGKLAVFWKIEPQKRGAPHFHLLLLMEGTYSLDGLRHWVSRTWYEVVASGDEKHLRAGTQVQTVDTWNGVMAYAAKYLGKVQEVEAGGWSGPGRWWGSWNEERWPRCIRQRDLPEKVLVMIRRACVAWYEHQPDTRRQNGQVLRKVRFESSRGRVGRDYLTDKFVEELRQDEFTVRELNKRWPSHKSASWSERTASGRWEWVDKPLGCSMFVPWEVFKRITDWACAAVRTATALRIGELQRDA